jgi:hypothetical protein
VNGGHLLLAPGLGMAPPLANLVVRLARGHRVHAHDAGLGTPTAVLCRPGGSWPVPKGDAAVAWWIEHPSEVPDAAGRRLALVLTWRPVADVAAVSLAGLGVAVEVLPSPSVDGSVWRPVAPFIRQRWRRRLGLPPTLVATLGVPGSPSVDEETAADALFLCSAAVVGPGHVLRALALGAPTVCDAATAEFLGAVDGVHVVVADGSAASEAAEDLADDLERATRLGRAGRRLVEARHDIAAAARRVASVLALPGIGPRPVADLAADLEALGTPVDAGISARVAGAIGTLGSNGPEVVARSLRW